MAVVVTIGLSAGWHSLFGYAAHARETHERAIATGFGLGLFGIGAGCSGWFLAALLGGAAALQDYQFNYIDNLKAASDIVSGNDAIDTNIMGALDTAASNLRLTGNAECGDGIVSGKRGKGVVCTSLKNSAAGMASMSGGLERLQQQRKDALDRSREAIGSAVRDIAAHKATEFQEDAARAATEIRTVAKIRLDLSSLNIGITAPEFAQRAIHQTKADLLGVISSMSGRYKEARVPDYQPIDAKRAMLTNPQPLPWLAAIVVEMLPLICLGLLLVVWRDEEHVQSEQSQSRERLRPRVVSASPAE